MPRKYNLASKSDMRKFEKDLRKDFKSAIIHSKHEITCDQCGHKFSARIGENVCPYCNKTFKLEFDMYL